MGLFVIALGAILLFAVSAGSQRWLNLHIVGIILICAGVLGLLLPRRPRLPRSPAYSGDRLNRRIRPGQLTSRRGRQPTEPPTQPPAAAGNGPAPTRAEDLRDERLAMADELAANDYNGLH